MTSRLADGCVIDALLVDVRLQGDMHGGLTVATEAFVKRPALPVLYTTGQGVTDGMKALFVEKLWVSKPYTVDLLITTTKIFLSSPSVR